MKGFERYLKLKILWAAMAQSMVYHVVLVVMFMLVAFGEAQTPPGIANNPSQATCKDPTYKQCHNLVHVCPKFCPNGCYVHCQSCKPICIGDTPPEIEPPTESTPPMPTPPSPPTKPSPTPTPPSQPKKVKCKNSNYPKCYAYEHVCPASCPGQCEVDCVTCKPVCNCDMPGAVCQDPRFIGGDGVTFYFHGKKDQDFCLVSDNNLHINGHFIGKRNKNMGRDFTWVQSIGVLFDNHKVQISALKTSSWDDATDRISVAFDGENIDLPKTEGAKWQFSTMSITRIEDTNHIVVEVENLFKITTKVVPITKEESRIHNYDITSDDCFAHLNLKFKFFSVTNEVDGVLGQTYKNDYVSKVKMGVLMPVMGGYSKFVSANLFAADCSVSKFKGSQEVGSSMNFQLPSLSCQSGIEGRGVRHMNLRGKPKSGKTTGGGSREPIHYILECYKDLRERLQKERALHGGNGLGLVFNQTRKLHTNTIDRMNIILCEAHSVFSACASIYRYRMTQYSNVRYEKATKIKVHSRDI
ncbi:hypothetical protein LXL04_038436 [Taraxacum kok-saghyz]